MIYISPLTQMRLSPTESLLKHTVHFSIVSHFSIWSHPQTGRSGAAGVGSGGRGQGAASGPPMLWVSILNHPTGSGSLLGLCSAAPPCPHLSKLQAPLTPQPTKKGKKMSENKTQLTPCCFSAAFPVYLSYHGWFSSILLDPCSFPL